MSPAALLLALLLAGPLAAQSERPRPSHLRIGDALPAVELEGLSQTEARSLAEFAGRVVLLDFVGYWHRACDKSVEHLEKLLAELGPRGFSIVAVTDDDERKTHAWVREHGIDYAYGFDTSGELHRLLRVERLPYAVLVDPFGTIVWSGNPLSLTAEPIERSLRGVTEAPLWTWPDAARALATHVWNGRYATALAACEDAEAAELVRGRIRAGLDRFERLVAAGEYRAAVLTAQRIDLGDLPEAAAMKERVRELLADAAVRRQAEADRELAELERRAETLRTLGETEAMRKVVSAFVERHAGEPIEQRARVLLATLDEALERVERD